MEWTLGFALAEIHFKAEELASTRKEESTEMGVVKGRFESIVVKIRELFLDMRAFFGRLLQWTKKFFPSSIK